MMRPHHISLERIEEPRSVHRYDLGGHTHYKLDCHFVWRTIRNRRILGPVLTPFLVRCIDEVLADKQVLRFGLAIAANHVHLCARLRPSQSPALVMQWVKSSSSREAFEQFSELAERLGGHRLWSVGYHVESLGEKNVFAILSYLGRQDEKHQLAEMEEYLGQVERNLMRAEEEGER